MSSSSSNSGQASAHSTEFALPQAMCKLRVEQLIVAVCVLLPSLHVFGTIKEAGIRRIVTQCVEGDTDMDFTRFEQSCPKEMSTELVHKT